LRDQTSFIPRWVMTLYPTPGTLGLGELREVHDLGAKS
jgi:hypothetical protein